MLGRVGRGRTLMVTAALWWSCVTTDGGSIPEGEGLRVINGIELYVNVMGAGSPLVVLHGGPGMDHSYLLPGLEVLAEHHQLIFYDQRATGRSVMDADSSTVSLDAFLSDVDGIRAAFDAMVKRLENTIPQARLVVLEEAGHFPYIEAPAELAAAIEGFLSEIDP